MRVLAPLALVATSAMAFQAPISRARSGRVSNHSALHGHCFLGLAFKLRVHEGPSSSLSQYMTALCFPLGLMWSERL